MEDRGQTNHFIALRNRCSLCTITASEAYDVFLRKTIHARFAVVFCLWKEANVEKNGQVSFRTKLKAQSLVNSDKKKRNTESPHSHSCCNDGSDQSMKRQRVEGLGLGLNFWTETKKIGVNWNYWRCWTVQYTHCASWALNRIVSIAAHPRINGGRRWRGWR